MIAIATRRALGPLVAALVLLAPGAARAGDDDAEARRRYDESYVHFEDVPITIVNQAGVTTAQLAIVPVPYRGRYKERIEGAAFYRAIGRADLASAYRRRRTIKIALQVGGVLVAAGGVAWAVMGLPRAPDCSGIFFADPIRECLEAGDRARATRFLIGVTLGLGGAGLVYWGGTMSPHPVTTPEARHLADEHNRRLRRELGLPDDDRARAPSLWLGLQADDRGGGLTLGGRF
jgi:hypothetical protein